MLNNKDFYPTPDTLITKMLEGINLYAIKTILEPSAGDGNIVNYVNNRIKNLKYGDKVDIDCIEIDQNLQHVLRGQEHKVIHDDFLTFQTYKKYDLIIANFPFSDDYKHLLHAIRLQQQSGGKIVCLINAETLRNAYSVTRQDLVRQLEELDAKIEYIQDAFTDAERKTGVEVALIRLDIKVDDNDSIILDKLKQDELKQLQDNPEPHNQVIDGDFIIGAIQRYNFEIKAGINLIQEYEKLKPYISNEFDEGKPLLSLKINEYGNNYGDSYDELVNTYIKKLRYKYWKTLFNSNEFSELMTEEMKRNFHGKLDELQDYDFSIYNINQIRADISKHLVSSLERTILNLFEDFTHKYNYSEYSKNIHMYNGWKTNKAYKINKKVILPLSGYSNFSYNGHRDLQLTWGTFYDKLQDVEKVFNYLDKGLTDHVDLRKALQQAQDNEQTKNIDTKYFNITVYKKGTTHLTFKNDKLLQKFNLFGSKSKNWLPPNYGKTKYNDMTQEEKNIVEAFQGKQEYEKIYNNQDYYIFNASDTLLLDNNIA